MKTPSGSEIKTWISIGDAIEIYSRVIYPVARISALRSCEDLLACWISPVAILIIEPDNAYAISLNDEKITLDQLLAMAHDIYDLSPIDMQESERTAISRR
jgi:hypothetical protein